jgi:hypothetical protein
LTGFEVPVRPRAGALHLIQRWTSDIDVHDELLESDSCAPHRVRRNELLRVGKGELLIFTQSGAWQAVQYCQTRRTLREALSTHERLANDESLQVRTRYIHRYFLVPKNLSSLAIQG